ncbi:MAG: HD domain-containing protein [Candidatus Nanosalina sp.]
MSLIKNGPRELHSEEVTYPPEEVHPDEVESYWAEEALVGTHFLTGQFSGTGNISYFPSRKGILGRADLEEAVERIDLESPFDKPEIWSFSPEGLDGDLLDVIFSDSFQNLRGKSQHGPISHFINRKAVSRFEHSIDALFLLRCLGTKTGAEIEPVLELKTLIHDIGHGAGSHWAEDVIGGSYEEHEERVKEVLEAEGLWERLERNYGNFLDKEYRLLDASKPDLSVDRLAYLLKDEWRLRGIEWTYLTEQTDQLPGEKPEENSAEWSRIGKILESTEIHEEKRSGEKMQELVMTSEEAAKNLAEIYMDLEEKVYFNPGYDAFNQGFADAARIALHNNSISEAEIFALPDREAINTIAEEDEDARQHLDRVFQHFIYGEGLEETDEEPDIVVNQRADVLDPKIREYTGQKIGEMDRVSEKSSELQEKISKHLQLDGEEIGYRVKGWDYPEIPEYELEGNTAVETPSVPRIGQALTNVRPLNDYWSRMKDEYREKDQENFREREIPRK